MGHQEFKETGLTGHQALELIFSSVYLVYKNNYTTIAYNFTVPKI